MPSLARFGVFDKPDEPPPFVDRRLAGQLLAERRKVPNFLSSRRTSPMVVVGISVFTHMNERDQFFYLDELRRVTRAGTMLFLTVSGTRVLERAETDSIIATMLTLPDGGLATARAAFDAGPGFCFLRQHGHLTSSQYEYGVTFISEAYIARNWSRYFELQDIVRGAIHDFQDIVVLRRRDDPSTPEPER